MQRLAGSDRRSEGSRVRNIRDIQKRKAWLKKQIARLQKDGGGSRSSGIRKTQLEKYRKELASLGGQGNLPTTTRSGGSKEKGMSNLGSDYKKEEKSATKEVKKWRKTDEYSKGVEKHNEKLVNKKTATKTPNTKLKTWRVNSDENKKLQTERKEGKDETYTRVTSKNDAPSSKNKNRLKSSNLWQALKPGASKKVLEGQLKRLKRSRLKASKAGKIKRLEALIKKKYG